MLEKLLYNDSAKQTLARLISGGRFPHAVLLEGPRGSGKRTFAKLIAAGLLCREEDPSKRPCGACLSCRKIESKNHPDLSVFEGTGAARSLHIDQIRELRQNAYILPHESECRVFLIADAHNMTTQSQNALLKIIEEPPQNVYFILTAVSRSMLLETVLSRTMTIGMQSLSLEERVEGVKALRPQADAGLVMAAAQFNPTVGQALEAIEDQAFQKLSQDAQSLYELCVRGDEYAILSLLFGYEKQRERFIRLLNALETVMVARLGGQGERLTALQSCRIADIIEETVRAAGQNAGLALLSAVTAGRIVRATGFR